ncbi:hypothetical protein RHSIM_Rhsim07G0137200 [Rhododendron simsii]|uniref:Protein ENHANCED DISEASE RESISTANCE 2-like n=1 Tax=Rhododendron simsii TaxID=118357 RepID=A0A834LJN5_RHOSS|nr:hypothetical protein RHSIM_Rhsim07G0137200 [Rhododendron simsii]
MSKVIYEGWMVRYGRRKIGRSFIHMRYFVLESRLLAYYKKKPQDNVVPIKTFLIDGNCRVEDRGLKTHNGHMVYVLSVYNKKEKYHRITMAAFNIQEALVWKEKIEFVIDQHQGSLVANGNKYVTFEYKSGIENGRKSSSSDQESQYSAPEDVDDSRPNLLRRTTMGNGPPESIFDWTTEIDSDLSNQNASNQAFSRKHWRLLQCQNGLRIFEELLEVDFLPKSCSRAMKAVGVVEATCEEIFELVMSMDATRFDSGALNFLLSKSVFLKLPLKTNCNVKRLLHEAALTVVFQGEDDKYSRWDCSFQYGSLVEEVDGHTAILYHRLQLDWFPVIVWPRDLCYVRYWRRNDDGSYVVLFRSREHENCGPQPGFVRAHIESGGFNISPLKSRNGRPRTQVQHLMQIDLKGWGVGYVSSFQQHCLLQMLNCVAGLREYFSQTDERCAPPRIPVMVNMASASASKKSQKLQDSSVGPSLDQINAANKNAVMMDEYSDDDDELQTPDQEASSSGLESEVKKTALEDECTDQIDLSCFSGNLRHDDRDNGRDCWKISDGNNFRVRSKNFCYDKSKIPAGKHLMDLVAVDWFKDTKRIDHVARRRGCAAQLGNIYLPPDKLLKSGGGKIGVHRPVGVGELLAKQVASEKGYFSIIFNIQVPGSTHYSMVFYFVSKQLVPGSLLQRFVDGDDEFRTSRLKLIPGCPKVKARRAMAGCVVEPPEFLCIDDIPEGWCWEGGNRDFVLEELSGQGSWIVRQSVGSTPCLLGKAIDCNYIRGPKYLEIDCDIGSSTVANGVLGLVVGVITTLVVDMAFLVQANTVDELPERLIGAVRVSHIELKSAIVPNLDEEPSG